MNDAQMIQTDVSSVLSPEELSEIDAELAHVPYKSGAAIDALKIVQAKRGWISDQSLQAIAKYLDMSAEELEGIATFYNLIYRRPVGKKVILFCDSVSCWICGCDGIKQKITDVLGVDYGETTQDDAYTLIPVPCLGACDRAPVMMVGDDLHTHLDEAKIDALFPDKNKKSGRQFIMEKVLTRNIGADLQPTDLKAYEANGGYQGLRKALAELSPKDCLDVISAANLRGRGGAGFPTGMKWSFVPMGDKCTPGHKYLVCNADEMEPGAFKDRLLMECDPHQLIEGMILSAYTIDADISYIFIRGEYVVAIQRLRDALAECYAAGYLGDNILGSGFSLNMYLHPSAGRYICGEETALINALEGKRANPRAKPPFPQVSGLWGRPTIVNNVETLCNISHIIDRGADWFKTLGVGEDSGTKMFGVSGRVKNPGCWELPMGTPIRHILEDRAGGMQDGLQLKGFLPGGGSTDFLTPDHLDLAMDYNVIGKAGSRMGTGTMIILDDQTCPVGMVLNLIRFFAHESCGFCTPCRDGLPWTRQVLEDIESGRGRAEDLDTLAYQVSYIGAMGNTHCALAPGAMEPLQSALKYFRDDFDRHISGGSCPYHSHTRQGA